MLKRKNYIDSNVFSSPDAGFPAATRRTGVSRSRASQIDERVFQWLLCEHMRSLKTQLSAQLLKKQSLKHENIEPKSESLISFLAATQCQDKITSNDFTK
jgi:hypothetical protein